MELLLNAGIKTGGLHWPQIRIAQIIRGLAERLHQGGLLDAETEIGPEFS